MAASTIEADYVIAGAGAVGMAFADTLLSHSTASIAIVDRRARPGGHWNDAYPFVRLHGPSAIYGVDSLPLGSGRIDAVGLNRGLHELASAPEVCAHFDRALQERLLPSGRVVYLPLHDCAADGVATSLLDGSRRRLVARQRWVDTTQADIRTPATHGPPFAVAPGVRCVSPTALAQIREPASGFVVVGAGKTGIDTVLWLLERGVAPERLTWIRPRDPWLLNRLNVQPTPPFAQRTLAAMVAEMEAAAQADSLDVLFSRLEAAECLLRIDPAVAPTFFRCAIVSPAELQQLRRVGQVVRLGRVRAIERHRIVLAHGEVPTAPDQVHVHCATDGLPRGPSQPVFQPGRIVPQYLRRCSPSFGAALTAWIEAHFDSDAQKNALCEPVPPPREPLDWLRMHLATARNQQRWQAHADLQLWLRQSRLEAYSSLFAACSQQAEPAWMALLQRLQHARAPALRRMEALLRHAEAPSAH